MRVLITVLLLVSCWSHTATAQRTTFNGKKLTPLRTYGNPSLSRQKSGSFGPVFDEAGYPYQGIGVKAGDPFAITFKFYFSERVSLVADFGRSTSSFYKTYYAGLFDLYFPDPNDSLTYTSHRTNADLVGELKLLYHIDMTSLMRGMQLYIGAGWEARDTKLQYMYTALPSASRVQDKRHQTQGIQGILGFEFANFQIPIVLFLEAELYYDLVKDPGWMRAQSGAGIRYIF